MEARTVGYRVVDGWLHLVRMPIDALARFLPNGDAGPRSAAVLVVDRADATVRATFGGLLRDDGLRADAQRRRIAADERERALRLRAVAAETTAEADQRLRREQEAAERKRTEAQEAAAKRSADVANEERARKSRVETMAAQKERAVEKARESKLTAAEKKARRERLDVLEDQEDALATKTDALTASDEAQRLRRAASAAKAERKTS